MGVGLQEGHRNHTTKIHRRTQRALTPPKGTLQHQQVPLPKGDGSR